jgi:hypothetical protein
MVALLGLEDRVIAQLYTFYKAFVASGSSCACVSTCQCELLDELIHSRVVDEHIYLGPFTQLRAIDTYDISQQFWCLHCLVLLQ